MRYHLFSSPSERYRAAILIKATAFNRAAMDKHYVQPLVARGLSADDCIAFTLDYNDKGKCPVAWIKEYLETLMPALQENGIEVLYVADAEYFKVLSGQRKAEGHIGYAYPCKLKGYEHMQVALGINYQALIYKPELQAAVDLSLDAVSGVLNGSYQPLGGDVIHSAQYPEGLKSIQEALNSLHQYPRLACDLESFSLRFNEAGIGTVAFAWNEHEGLAFLCDYQALPEKNEAGEYGANVPNHEVRALLKDFFTNYQGELIWHNSAFDVRTIIATLWMKDWLDQRGLLDGLHIMFRKIQDTKIIAWLATNSTAGNELSLKKLAHEFAGNWAQSEIKDIRRIPLPELLEYNQIDACCTVWVFNKYYPKMVEDQQEQIYLDLMLPSQKLLTQTELTGMPMNAQRLQEVKQELMSITAGHLNTLVNHRLIQEMDSLLQYRAWEKDYADRKAKAKNPEKIQQKELSAFADVRFNPGSGPQKQWLLYELMGMPVIDKTDTGQPATGGDTLEKLKNHTDNPEYVAIIEALMGLDEAEKILSTFIPSFEEGIKKADDGVIWLHGNFNIGGTVSGRLSSSGPNLQNLPSNSTYGKLIKTIFSAPPGHLFAGADFNALEARIDALTTRDKNKLAIYIDGMDSHSFNALSYWPEKMPNISRFLTDDHLAEQHYRVEYSDGTFEYLPESLLPC